MAGMAAWAVAWQAWGMGGMGGMGGGMGGGIGGMGGMGGGFGAMPGLGGLGGFGSGDIARGHAGAALRNRTVNKRLLAHTIRRGRLNFHCRHSVERQGGDRSG